jgi:cobalt-precorrin 5A hydrolase/precorrin-3B C17-methyltransferase
VTEQGAQLARRLPYEHVHGDAAGTLRDRWAATDGFVVFLALGATVRIIAPLLNDKRTDPAVVCVDEAGRYAVAVCGGHAGGGNDLAQSVASALGAEAIVTTATDATGTPALDLLPGFAARGDVAAASRAILDGRSPTIVNALNWPLPPSLPSSGDGPQQIVVTDLRVDARPGTAVLHPPSLVIGVGASRGAPRDEVAELIEGALSDFGLARDSVAEVATADIKAGEPAITGLGWSVRTFEAAALAAVDVPTPSAVVEAAVGTPSVAEAAALLAAGPGAILVVPKRKSPSATVAVARRSHPRG